MQGPDLAGTLGSSALSFAALSTPEIWNCVLKWMQRGVPGAARNSCSRRAAQNNVWAGFAIGTSLAHSWSSLSARLTRVLTGYFFISLESNGLRVSATSATLVI